MTVQEIFNTTAVREIELQILDIYHEIEKRKRHRYEGKETICQLLEIRKRILDSMFVLDENYKVLKDSSSTDNEGEEDVGHPQWNH